MSSTKFEKIKAVLKRYPIYPKDLEEIGRILNEKPVKERTKDV